MKKIEKNDLLKYKEDIDLLIKRKEDLISNLDELKNKFKIIIKEEKNAKRKNELIITNNRGRNLSKAMIFLFAFLTYSFFGYFSIAGLAAFIILYSTSTISLMKLLRRDNKGFLITRNKMKELVNDSNNEVKYLEEKRRNMEHNIKKNEVYIQEMFDIIENKKDFLTDFSNNNDNCNNNFSVKENDIQYIKKR